MEKNNNTSNSNSDCTAVASQSVHRSVTRSIKFRAWDMQEREMIAADHAVKNILMNQAIHDNVKPPNNGKDYTGWIYFMQYTGLKDKNGKEIYEGDIMQERYTDYMEDSGFGLVTVRVDFRDGAFGWIGEITGRFYSFADEPLDTYEVIGNVYEHPHLLNSEQEVKECDATEVQ